MSEKISGVIKNNILDFLLGGNCTASVMSTKTGKKFTYNLQVRLDEKGQRIDGDTQMYFVKIDTNYLDFVYAGYIKVNRVTRTLTYTKGAKGAYDDTAPPIKGLIWILERCLDGRSTDGLEVYHLGTCGKCGRPLTDPVSIETGLGPKCGGRIGKSKKTNDIENDIEKEWEEELRSQKDIVG